MSTSEAKTNHAQLTASDVVQRVRDDGLGLVDLVFSDITGGARW